MGPEHKRTRPRENGDEDDKVGDESLPEGTYNKSGPPANRSWLCE